MSKPGQPIVYIAQAPSAQNENGTIHVQAAVPPPAYHPDPPRHDGQQQEHPYEHSQPHAQPGIPNNHEASHLQSAWVGAIQTRVKKEETKKEKKKETNPVRILYDSALNVAIGRWFCSLFVLGFAAGIISKKPTGPLLIYSAYNLACASAHFFLFGPRSAPISPTNMRPPTWYFVLLSISSAMWVVAFSLMLTVISRDDEYIVVDLRKRGGFGGLVGVGLGTVDMLQNITIACACLGIACFIMCLAQWWYVVKMVTGKFTEADMAEAYRKEMERKAGKKTESSNGFA